MKIEHTRGMRDIPTIQGLRRTSLPSTREHAVAEQARLEHERARLKRELSIWIGNQRRTEGRLRQVEERLVLLQQILGPPVADDAAKCARVRQSPAGKAAGHEDEAPGWQEIPLEY
jgi:hypothetical protein